MIYKAPSPRSNYIRVVFELPASLWADRVYLVGDFNQWNASATPLRQDRQGAWRTEVELPAHTNQHFYYLVDGSRRTDFYADGWTEDPSGSQQSVIITNLPQQ